MLRSALLACLLFAGLPSGAAAAADETPRVTVPHDDLDLMLVSDRKKLDRRMRRAIKTLCPGSGIELRVNFSVVRCRQVATASAKEQVRKAVAAAAGESSPARFAGDQVDDRS